MRILGKPSQATDYMALVRRTSTHIAKSAFLINDLFFVLNFYRTCKTGLVHYP
jgi:hypothetical protein